MSDERETKPQEQEQPDAADAARRTVLARRARFVAAAVASVGLACGKTDAIPQPCLEPVPADAAAPMPCLTVTMTADTPPPPRPADAGEAPTPSPPMPCLSVAMDAGGAAPAPTKPAPRPCLSIPAPRDGGPKGSP